jgi:predicted enzyme related to lactoylglutathione lyase
LTASDTAGLLHHTHRLVAPPRDASAAEAPAGAKVRDDLPVATIGLVLDCEDPEALAEFWAAALGYTNVGSAGSYVLLLPPDPTQPKLLLQRVPEPKSSKNRMHLDILANDIDAEAARLESIGARRVSSAVLSEFGMRWHVLADPEGNELCVCDDGQAS